MARPLWKITNSTGDGDGRLTLTVKGHRPKPISRAQARKWTDKVGGIARRRGTN